jgi:hypothetical protein
MPLWGGISFATFCVLATTAYAMWRGREPAILIRPFRVFDEKSAMFKGETAATELAAAFTHLRDEARQPVQNSALWQDDEPLQLWDFEFPALSEIVLDPEKDDSIVEKISQARRFFGRQMSRPVAKSMTEKNVTRLFSSLLCLPSIQFSVLAEGCQS